MTRKPKNWQWIAVQIKKRAGYHCEMCGLKNGRRGWFQKGRFKMCGVGVTPPDAGRVIRVSLDVVAIDGDPFNCDLMDHYGPAPAFRESNLIAVCQKCLSQFSKPKPKTKNQNTQQAEQPELL